MLTQGATDIVIHASPCVWHCDAQTNAYMDGHPAFISPCVQQCDAKVHARMDPMCTAGNKK